MADKKITQFTELTTPANDDLLVIVDVSDPTHGASGTTKKIKKSNLVPTKTSDLTNDGDDGVNPFITSADLPTIDFIPLTGTEVGSPVTGDIEFIEGYSDTNLYKNHDAEDWRGRIAFSDGNIQIVSQNTAGTQVSSIDINKDFVQINGTATKGLLGQNFFNKLNDPNTFAQLGDIATSNVTSTPLTVGTLNATYPTQPTGFMVICPTIDTIYVKSSLTTWEEVGGGAVDSVNGQTGVVVLTKSDVGLSNVDNTTDLNKPISTATQTALNAKQNTLIPGTNITIVGDTISASGGGTIDAVPTDGSANAVSSNGVFDALANKVDKTNWIDISATSTIVGFSVFTIKDIKYKIVDTNLAIVRCDIQGTSNSTGISYTLPFTSANDVHNVTPAYITNNGTVSTTNGLAVCNANSSTIVVLRDNQGNLFTTTGTKRCSFTIIIRL